MKYQNHTKIFFTWETQFTIIGFTSMKYINCRNMKTNGDQTDGYNDLSTISQIIKNIWQSLKRSASYSCHQA